MTWLSTEIVAPGGLVRTVIRRRTQPTEVTRMTNRIEAAMREAGPHVKQGVRVSRDRQAGSAANFIGHAAKKRGIITFWLFCYQVEATARNIDFR